MIAQVHRSGSSFRSAAEYCLGDKILEALKGEDEPRRKHEGGDPSWKQEIMSDRVAWTQTRHLHTDNPYRAARMMAATVSYAPALKEHANVKSGGRTLEKPVYHYSLAWKDGEQVSRKEQEQAVQSSLRSLGLSGRQALVIAHRDTAHSHVHVIVNRVSHKDGRAAKVGRDHRTLSRWAERYERDRGQIQCRQRVENNRRRAAGEKKVYENKHPSKAAYHRQPPEMHIKRHQFNDLAARPRRDYELTRSDAEKEIHAETKAMYEDFRSQVKEHQDAQWHGLYKQQKQERSTYSNPADRPALLKYQREVRSNHRKSNKAEFENLNKCAQRHYDVQVKEIAAIEPSRDGYTTTSAVQIALEHAANAIEQRSGAQGGLSSKHDPFQMQLQREREREIGPGW